MTEPTGYPHHLAGDPAPPPEPVTGRVLEMALKAASRARAAAPPLVETVAPWRVAAAVEVLFAEADAAAPHRSRVSDGRKGDARHEALGKASDHNAWLIYKGQGIVRAGDVTNDPALDLAAAYERLRALAHARKLPQVLDGGYAIVNGRITAEDWSGWRVYTGQNPHVAEGHVSVSLNPAQFDSRAPWGIFTAAAPPAPAPPRRPPGWAGPDLRGAGLALRGEQGNSGPRVQAWQRFMRDRYPLYAKHLAVDGEWGPQTTAVNREFGRRSGVPSADGTNIGPQLAAAYWRAGLFRTLSAAQLRVAGHLTRDTRR